MHQQEECSSEAEDRQHDQCGRLKENSALH
jgi:hypothetical protein